MQLTEEQTMLREMVRDFVDTEVAPIAAEIDETEAFPYDNMTKMAELGLLGIPFPDEYGGAGMDTISFAIAIEELGRACGSTCLTVAAHTSLAGQPIFMFGTEEQKRKYLAPLAAGEMLGAFCLTEPQSGSDAGAMKTTAVLEGDHYILNGNKAFVTNGGVAGLFIVMAKTDLAPGSGGISCFIVEKEFDGLKVGKRENKMGLRASETREVFFQNCRVPKANLLGTEGQGFKQALAVLDGGRIGIGAMAVGLAQGALNHAARYAQERQAFGKPIARHQAIQWMLADMATNIHAGRLMVHEAARLKDAGKPFTKEAAMAKLFASEMAMKATSQAIQVLGGFGYCKDYPVERFYRDVKLTEIGEGTSEVQRMVIAREVIGSYQ